MRGTFRQTPDQSHVAARQQLLEQPGRLPELSFEAARVGVPDGLAVQVGAQLRSRGVAVVQLVEPLSTTDLLAFGAGLGTPQVERAAAVQQHVEEGVILNLVTSVPPTADADLQPFAAGWLSLHSESSGAPIARQPRYIVLLCVTTGERQRCAETVLVPMPEVLKGLPVADLRILENLRYDIDGAPTVLRRDGDRHVLSLRDFQAEALTWVYEGPEGLDPVAVNTALTRLYTAMYTTGARVVRWREAMLVVIDNTVYLHGRTAGIAAEPGSTRHLKRMRITPKVPA